MKKSTQIFGIIVISVVGIFSILLFAKYNSTFSSLGLKAEDNNTTHQHQHPHTKSDSGSDISTLFREDGELSVEDENVSNNAASPVSTEGNTPVLPKQQVVGIYESFKNALDLKETDPAKAQEEIHAIAYKLGNGDPDLTEYFHLLGHSLLLTSPGETEMMAFPIEEALVFLKLHAKFFGETEELKAEIRETQATYNWDRDWVEIKRQVEPIMEVINWMKDNANNEGQIVAKAYLEKLNERAMPKFPIADNWLTIEERVDIQYQAFIEALELLPDNAKTLEVLYDSYLETAESTLLNKQAAIKASPSPVETPTDTHTWDTVHDRSTETGSLRQIPPKLLSNKPRNQTDDSDTSIAPGLVTQLRKDMETVLEKPVSSVRFNRAQELFSKYGIKEGLNQLKKDDPELATMLERHFQHKQNQR